MTAKRRGSGSSKTRSPMSDTAQPDKQRSSTKAKLIRGVVTLAFVSGVLSIVFVLSNDAGKHIGTFDSNQWKAAASSDDGTRSGMTDQVRRMCRTDSIGSRDAALRYLGPPDDMKATDRHQTVFR